MDSLTQIVLGAGVGELVLGKKAGNKAMLWGAIAGTVPDLDVFGALFTDPLHAMLNHRGFMHSIVFCALFAPLMGWFIHRVSKNKNISAREWSWLAWWSLVTHPLLDAFTTWGTQLFWPFEYRVTWNGVFVIDPLYTLPYIVFLILAMRKKKDNPKRFRYAKLGFYLSTGYLFFGLGMRLYSTSVFESSLREQGIAFDRSDVKPMPFTTFYWECTAEGKDVFYTGAWSVFGNASAIQYRSIPKQHELADVIGLSQHPDYKALQRNARGFYALELKGDTLEFHDLRFGQTDAISSHIEKRSNFVYLLQLKEGKIIFHRKAPAIAQGFSFLGEYFGKVFGN